VFFPDFFGFEWLKWAFLLWAIPFLFVSDIQMTYKEGKKKCEKEGKKEGKRIVKSRSGM
jgi:hypothetical protein